MSRLVYAIYSTAVALIIMPSFIVGWVFNEIKSGFQVGKILNTKYHGKHLQ